MEQILALFNSSPSLSSSIVIQLVKRATSHKSIYGFSEFYEPLRARQHANSRDTSLSKLAELWIDILEVFTYGTWSDLLELKYKTNAKSASGSNSGNKDHNSSPDNSQDINDEDQVLFPELNEIQLKKMKQLTLVSLAGRSETLTYNVIKEALQPAWATNEDSEMKGTGGTGEEGEDDYHTKDTLESEIEPLVIDTIYADLLDARIHSREREVEILWAAGRDVSPKRLEEISNIFTNWNDMALNLFRQTQESIDTAKVIVNN